MKLSLLFFAYCLCVLTAVSITAQGDDSRVARNIGTKTPVPQVGTVSESIVKFRETAYSSLARVGVQQSQTLTLTLAEAILRALENNNDIELSRDNVRIQETQVRALRGFYDPVFTISPSYFRNSTTGSTATKDIRINSNMGHAIERTGGNYQVFFNNQRTENAFGQAQVSSGSVSSSGSAVYSSATGITFTQPLFRNLRIDNTRRQITIARRRLEQTDTDFRLQATTTITTVQRAYWDYVFALRNQQNQVANVNLAKENLRQVEAKIEAGAAAPLERAEVATELANREGELLLATQSVANAENALKLQIIGDPLSPEWSVNVIPTDLPKVNFDPLSLDESLKDAIDNRFELKRVQLEKKINGEDIKFFRNQTKPQIDLNTTFSLDGLSRSGRNSAIATNLLTASSDLFLFNSLNTTRQQLGLQPLTNPAVTIPASPSFLFGGFNRSLSNIFRTDAPNFNVGVTISFPFRSRTAKANLEGAKIQEHQLEVRRRGQEQDIIVEVRNAVQAVETSRQRVLTARRARENGEIQLAGEQKLYEAGRSTSFLLFQRENALTNARNAEIRAETDYNKALADVQRVTATAFRENNIQIVSPVNIPK